MSDSHLSFHMADVSAKEPSVRLAIASGKVVMKSETLRRIKEGKLAKGDPLAAAQIAGIMAAKATPQIIPMCHPIPIDHVSVELRPEGDGTIAIEAKVQATAKTGVEMEALTAVTASALTLYDMCKPFDRSISITDIRLVRKSGGKSADFVAPA